MSWVRPASESAASRATAAAAGAAPLLVLSQEPVVLAALPTVPLPPSKLDAIACQATKRPAGQAQQQQQHAAVAAPKQPKCSECGSIFVDSQAFFGHWLEHHCRPEVKGGQAGDSGSPNSDQRRLLLSVNQSKTANAIDRSNLSLEQCRGCTPKFEEHKLTCSNRKRKAEEPLTTSATPSSVSKLNVTLSSLLPNAAVVAAAAAAAAAAASSSSRPASAASSQAKVCVSCGVCESEVKSITSFFLHWLDEHQAISEILQEVWRCGVCAPNKLFPDETRLREHFASVHAEHRNPENARVCSYCQSALSGDVHFEYHMEVHRRLSQMSCPSASECPRCAKPFVHLMTHFETVHERPCPVCTMRVAETTLRTHLSAAHRFERIWDRTEKQQQQEAVSVAAVPPTTAPKQTSNVSSSSTMATPLPPPPAGHDQGLKKCKACALPFSSEKLLEKHYLANHEFQCKFCDKTMDKDLYGDHLRAHLAKQRKSRHQQLKG